MYVNYLERFIVIVYGHSKIIKNPQMAERKILKWRNENAKKSSNGGTKNPQMAENIF